MKYFQLFLGIVFFVLLMILYFQLLAGAQLPVLMFTKYIMISVWTLIVILFAFLSGVFMTLGIKGLLSHNSEIDDGFDL